VACRDHTGTEWIGLPSLTGAKTMIIAYEVQGAAPDVRLVDLARADAPIFPLQSLGAGEQVELEALLYTETSTDLGLSPGPLQPTTSATAGQKLPPPATGAVFHRSLGPHLDASWAPSTTVSSALASFRVPTQTSTECVGFDLEPRSLPGARLPMWWTQLDAGSALVGTANAALFRLRDGVIQRLTVSATLGAALSGGLVDPGGQLWLVSTFGQLFRGGIDNDGVLTATLVSTAPEPATFRWFDGDFDPSDFDLIMLSRTGQLWRFDGSAWTKLLTLDTPGTQRWDGGVLRVGPHHVLAAIDSDLRIFSVVAGTAAPVAFGPFPFESVDAMTASPLGPVLAISSAPALYVYRDPGLTALSGVFSPLYILTLTPFRNGVLGVSAEGVAYQYVPTRACPAVQATRGHHGIAILGVGRSVAVVGDDLQDGTSIDVTFARPRN
jgi:hypothetical protein